LTKITQQFKSVQKDRLFYNRFEYAIGFTLDEVSCLRDLSHKEINRTIERRKEWREISLQRSNTVRKPGLWPRRKEITNKTVEDLHALAELLLTISADYKLVVSANQGHVYTNDLTLIDKLNKLDYLDNKSYSRADINRPQNTIQLKNPRHQLRSYFKITKITDDQKRNIRNFLDNQRESIRISPALERWLLIPLTRTQDYFFIDHDEMIWLTMMALVHPSLIRKTQQIIQAK
jgi:hypothetical protein